MLGMDSNHCRIVGKSLRGERAVDEQTFASLTVLGERLIHLKKLDNVFLDIEFSPAARKLSKQKKAVTIC